MTYPFLESFAAAAYPCYWRAADGDFWMNDAAAEVDNPLYREDVVRRLLADIADSSPDTASPWVGSATRLRGLSVLPLEGGLLAAMTGSFEVPSAVIGNRMRDSLTNVFSSLSLLAKHSKEAAEEEELEAIQRNCYALLRLASNLEGAGAASNLPKDPAPIDLCGMLARTVDSVREVLPGRDIPLDLSLPEEPLFIRGSALMLERGVLNILRNSLQYTRDGNHIGIKLRRAGRRALLTIEDTGLGIRPENLGRIFEPYFSAEPYGEGSAPGLGLGLAVAREVVLAHGGSITCESRFGAGTTISLSLPLDEGEVPLKSKASPPSLNRFSPVFIQLEGLCLPYDLEEF